MGRNCPFVRPSYYHSRVCVSYVCVLIYLSECCVVLMYSAAKVPELLMAIIVVAVSAVVCCPITFAGVA